MDIIKILQEELGIRRGQVETTIKLIDEGNTIPFISRYRKEATGELNDEQLRKLYERLVYLKNLEEKKEQVISSIEEQGISAIILGNVKCPFRFPCLVCTIIIRISSGELISQPV